MVAKWVFWHYDSWKAEAKSSWNLICQQLPLKCKARYFFFTINILQRYHLGRLGQMAWICFDCSFWALKFWSPFLDSVFSSPGWQTRPLSIATFLHVGVHKFVCYLTVSYHFIVQTKLQFLLFEFRFLSFHYCIIDTQLGPYLHQQWLQKQKIKIGPIWLF